MSFPIYISLFLLNFLSKSIGRTGCAFFDRLPASSGQMYEIELQRFRGFPAPVEGVLSRE